MENLGCRNGFLHFFHCWQIRRTKEILEQALLSDHMKKFLVCPRWNESCFYVVIFKEKNPQKLLFYMDLNLWIFIWYLWCKLLIKTISFTLFTLTSWILRKTHWFRVALMFLSKMWHHCFYGEVKKWTRRDFLCFHCCRWIFFKKKKHLPPSLSRSFFRIIVQLHSSSSVGDGSLKPPPSRSPAAPAASTSGRSRRDNHVR